MVAPTAFDSVSSLYNVALPSRFALFQAKMLKYRKVLHAKDREALGDSCFTTPSEALFLKKATESVSRQESRSSSLPVEYDQSFNE